MYKRQLGAQFPIAVLTVKDVALMDVGRPLVQMDRPVQDVDMGTEAALKFLIKLIDCLLYTSALRRGQVEWA